MRFVESEWEMGDLTLDFPVTLDFPAKNLRQNCLRFRTGWLPHRRLNTGRGKIQTRESSSLNTRIAPAQQSISAGS